MTFHSTDKSECKCGHEKKEHFPFVHCLHEVRAAHFGQDHLQFVQARRRCRDRRGRGRGVAAVSARSHATSTALAVVDNRAAMSKARRDADFPDLKSGSKSGSTVDGEAYAAGKRAGASINSRTQIGAGGARMLGGG